MERDVKKIRQTCFLRRGENGPEQKIVIRDQNGEQEIYFPEVQKETERIIIQEGIEIRFLQKPVRHYDIHLVQLSHHDRGYTGVPDDAVRMQAENIRRAVCYLEETKDYPEEAKFRLVLEQFWSLEAFLTEAQEEEKQILYRAFREGRAEVTALFGNMITENCSGEELLDALSMSERFAGQHRITIVSAEHNDIPGFSASLADALVHAGVKVLYAGLPLYYDWGNAGLPSFWKEEEIFGRKGPGAFWWEAENGGRVLFWCGNSGCGGPARLSFPGLTDALEKLEDSAYPYSAVRWVVSGAEMDNSVYLKEYCDAALEWNKKWIFPKMVISTEKMFYDAVISQLPQDLPVFRGEVPVQDYLSGTRSAAGASAQNRRNQSVLYQAESLEVILKMAGVRCRESDQIRRAIENARREILLYDEHTFGFHFPAGPGCEAAVREKELYAYRGAAYLQDAVEKAKACLADRLAEAESEGKEEYRIVVLNPLPCPASAPIQIPFREPDNAGQYLRQAADGGEIYYKPAQCGGRMHVSPQGELLQGNFRLWEETPDGEIEVRFQAEQFWDAKEPEPYAAQKYGLSLGGRRFGIFEEPDGLRKSIGFVARDVPAFGWKTYRARPIAQDSASAARSTSPIGTESHTKCGVRLSESNFQTCPGGLEKESRIENEFFRIRVTKGCWSFYDKTEQKELLSREGCQFGEILVSDAARDRVVRMERFELVKVNRGDVMEEMYFAGKTLGHPDIRMRLRLYQGIRQAEIAYSILKDSTPLLSCAAAFPFAGGKDVSWQYDGPLQNVEKGTGFLPGAADDIIAVQKWLKQSSGGYDIVCVSADTAVFSTGSFKSGYLSPAHACIPDRIRPENPVSGHPEGGGMFALLFSNNFGTNFQAAQSGTCCFQFYLTAGTAITPEECRRFGDRNLRGLTAVWKHPQRNGGLPARAGLFRMNPDIDLLFAREEQEGIWIGLKNRTGKIQDAGLEAEGREETVRLYTADFTGSPAERAKSPVLLRPGEIKYLWFGRHGTQKGEGGYDERQKKL